MTFADPLFFLLLAPLLGWAVAAFLWRRKGVAAFEFSSFSLVGRHRSLRSLTAWAPSALLVAALVLLIFALARPQRVTSFTDERMGIDIVIALDASGSMAAEDFGRGRNRFIVARELIDGFIAQRTSDRIGIVTFGTRAATRVPITFDRDVARQVLEQTAIGDNGDGTAIGHAVATAVNRLRNSKARSRVVVLLTDGVNNAGSIEPMTAAGIAAELGVKIYTVGVGSRGEVPIPVRMQDRLTGEVGTVYRYIRADLDETMLTAMAESTGGSYFRAADEKTLNEVFRRIDALEKSSLAAPRRQVVDELFVWPLAAGLLLLTLGIAAGETLWMRLPA